ncbi:aminotransferase class III-fold pyridoxal phosphate-dependent enzyme [Corynebacterium diphtheriae]|nr:aminotransferase class III-fold pyridoxal phosphate-dependent enzyme [Corynebacterium diphtheriae]
MVMPATVSEGSGSYLKVGDRWFLDASSGAMNVNLGHGYAPTIEAMGRGGNSAPYILRGEYTSNSIEEFDKRVLSLLGEEYSDVIHGVTGSDSIEQALRIVMQYWGARGQRRRNIILSDGISYHGMTRWALDASGHEPRRKGSRGNIIDPAGTINVPVTIPGHRSTLESWKETIESYSDQLAAIIYEPVGGASSGSQCLTDDELSELGAVAHQHDIPVISDEVMCGFGRLLEPSLGARILNADIVVASKGLGAGYYPISVAVVNETLSEALSEFDTTFGTFGHTMARQPLASSVANSILDEVESPRLKIHMGTISQRLENGLQEIEDSYPHITITGRGLQKGIHPFRVEDPMELALKMKRMLLEDGVIVHISGVDSKSGSLLIGPPLNSSESDIDLLLESLDSCLKTLQ